MKNRWLSSREAVYTCTHRDLLGKSCGVETTSDKCPLFHGGFDTGGKTPALLNHRYMNEHER